jgi:TolB-like protein/DNA-binding winged helix-turn-helix (wHTH) protein/Tfp pilus assembly protein PilF
MSAQRRPGTWQIGDWIADPADDTLTRGVESIKLEPRMMRLLLRLAERPGAVISQDQLLIDVWAGVIVGSASVYQAVSQLRKVLGDTGEKPSYIDTVARKGYRLIAPAQPPSERSPPLPAPADPAKAVPQSKRWRRIATVGGIGLGIAAILAVVGGGWVWRYAARAPLETSIAVLPFTDLTAGRTEQPFCDGVTEELSNWLAQIPTLRVVGRSSAFAFRDKQTDVREIGRALGTTHVLEGTLRKAGDVLRVTVQLIGTRDGYNVWSASFDAAAGGLIRVQEEVARAVANNLELRLTDTAMESLAERRSTKERAYTLYLVARHHQQQRTKQDNDRAIELYKQAIAADSDFALAQIALASAYVNQRYFDDRPIEEIAQDAQPLLETAARLAPRLAELYVARGALKYELGDADAALKDLHHAVELNPNSRDAEAELGYDYLYDGQPAESLRHYDYATRLDPLDYYLYALRCVALSDLGDYAQAAASCERARALGPSAAWAYNASGLLEESRGRIGEALKWNTEVLARNPDVTEVYAERGRLLVALGLPERARQSYETAALAAGDTGHNPLLAWLDLVTLYAQAGPDAVRTRIAADHLDSGDDPRLSFEIASVELMVGDAAQARALVDRALQSPKLRQQDLVSSSMARTGRSYLLIAAAAHQATGDPGGASAQLVKVNRLVARLLSAGMRRHSLYEVQAQAAALQGRPEEAVLALQNAVALGWREAWLAEQEPYFASLRARADYRALIDRVRADNARETAALASDQTTTPAPKS